MGGFDADEVARVAKLARLRLGPGEAERLGMDLAAITAQFAKLADFAADLPPPAEEPAGPLRADEAMPSDPETPREILAAAPQVDATGALRVPRGRP